MTTDAKIRAAVEALVTALVDAARAPQPAPPAEYLTTAGAATVAAVNEGTIRRWVRAGKLRGYRAGRVLRVRRDELCLRKRGHDGAHSGQGYGKGFV